MEDIKGILAQNISALRQANGMTQLELAERINYSDKAISKWERGESAPDISVLVQLATIFGVTLDYLVTAEHPEHTPCARDDGKPKYNRKAIAYVSESGAWIVAILAFIITSLIVGAFSFQFLYFVYTLPVVFIVRLVFNSIWFNPRHNYFIVSGLMWSILLSLHITFLYFGVNVALVYLLGAVGQLAIVLCSFISKPKRKQ